MNWLPITERVILFQIVRVCDCDLLYFNLIGNSDWRDTIGFRSPEKLLQNSSGHGFRKEDVHSHSVGWDNQKLTVYKLVQRGGNLAPRNTSAVKNTIVTLEK